MNDVLEIVCIKTGSKYGPEYVNNLSTMLWRNLDIPYRFTCYSDDFADINCELVKKHISEFDLNETVAPGWWQKINLFNTTTPLLYIDLDVVIVDNITKMIAKTIKENKFTIIQDWWQQCYNSSLMFITPEHRDIFEAFKMNTQLITQRFAGDQDWISVNTSNLRLWDASEVVSYKANGIIDNHSLPDNAKIVVFHGEPKPHQVQDKFVLDNWNSRI